MFVTLWRGLGLEQSINNLSPHDEREYLGFVFRKP